MKKWPAMLLTLLALALVVPACGGDDDDEGSGNGGGANTEQPADGGGGGAGTEVSMQNIQFDPAELSIAPGDTVTWVNDEGVPHDVQKTGGPGPEFSSGPEGGMSEGDTFEHTFEDAGTYEYVCRVHAPGMAGTVTVK
jgi:plastocyanin